VDSVQVGGREGADAVGAQLQGVTAVSAHGVLLSGFGPRWPVVHVKVAVCALQDSWIPPVLSAPCFNAPMTSSQPWWLTMPPAEVAAVILPYFSSAPSQSESEAVGRIVSSLKTGKWRAPVLGRSRFEDPDYRAVAEAIQALEHAGLLMRVVSGHDLVSVNIGLTRLGWHALQTNTVRQHLGFGDAPPSQM
jgi:hypothetical protein